VITYDNFRQVEDPIKAMTKGRTLPDVIDIGENNAYWFSIRRSSRSLEVKDKVTGQIVAKGHLGTLAQEYNLTTQQISSAKAGLAL